MNLRYKIRVATLSYLQGVHEVERAAEAGDVERLNYLSRHALLPDLALSEALGRIISHGTPQALETLLQLPGMAKKAKNYLSAASRPEMADILKRHANPSTPAAPPKITA